MNATAYATRPESAMPNAGFGMPQAPQEAVYILAPNHQLGPEGSLIDRFTGQHIQLEVGQVAVWSSGDGRQSSEIYKTSDGDLSMLARDADGNWPTEVVTRLEDIRDRLQAQHQQEPEPSIVAPFSAADVTGEVMFDSWDQQPQAETDNTGGLRGRINRVANYLKSLASGRKDRSQAPESRTDQSRPQGEQRRAKSRPGSHRRSTRRAGKHRR